MRAKFLEHGEGWEVEASGIRNVLPPKQRYSGEAPTYYLKYYKHREAEDVDEFRLTIVGEVDYIDAFGDERTQPFGRLCRWNARGRHATEFLAFDGHLKHQIPGRPQSKPKDQSQP